MLYPSENLDTETTAGEQEPALIEHLAGEYELRALLEDKAENFFGGRKPVVDRGKLVDYVLAYQPSKLTETMNAYREVYEEKLRNKGLILNTQPAEHGEDGITAFVKIRAPSKLLCTIAHNNRLQVPIQESDIYEEQKSSFNMKNATDKLLKILCCGKNPCQLKPEVLPPEKPMYFTSEFDKNRMSEFLVEKGESRLFTEIQRMRMVWGIMQTSVINTWELDGHRLNAHREKDYVGLNFLLQNGIYAAAYPLHDSDIEFTPFFPLAKPGQMRRWLSEFWARPGRWNKYQPLDEIRTYFGEKIAMYFAWLGFYTCMLIPLSIIGIFCFIFGFAGFEQDEPMRDVCFREEFTDVIICRACGSSTCHYHKLDSYCSYTIINAIVGNPTTIPFALILCTWSILFMELTKRYQARLACKWGTIEFQREYEPPRPEYQVVANRKRLHPVTHQPEPYISTGKKWLSVLRSITGATFFICIVLSVVVGVIVYRATMVVVFFRMRRRVSFIEDVGSSTFTSVTASIMSIAGILILEKIYSKVAYFLTEKEYPRTNTDFENSFTFKMYVFQFINYYSALFYLAFVKGFDVMNVPHTIDNHFSDYCSPVGCTLSVTTQLCIILVVKQFMFNILEIGKPAFHNWRLKRKETFITAKTQHEKDFQLPEIGQLGLLNEYLEMVLQYGFVVMFSAVFPIAPVFALINNIAEIRVDAYKYLNARRVRPQRAADIGNWYKVLTFVTKLAVLTNALVIAFTTDIVDRYCYKWYFSPKPGSLQGYMNFSLSIFTTEDWPASIRESDVYGNVSLCYYRGHYYPPGDPDEYKMTGPGWIILLGKIAFVLAFQNVTWWLHSFIKYLVPDKPEEIELHVLRSHYVAREWMEAADVKKTSRAGFHKKRASQRRRASDILE